MKLRYALFSICILFFTRITPLFSQQTDHSTIPLGAPSVINFKDKAAFQLLYPAKKQEPRFIEQGEDREGEREFKPKPVPDEAKKFDVKVPKNTLRTTSPAPQISFTGTVDGGYLIPPDVSGAAGIDFIIETTNQQIDIYEKTGDLNSTLDIANFFSGENGTSYFDPRIVYDPGHHRWIICLDGFYSSNYHSALFLGISETEDPTGNWYTYSIDAVGNGNDFLDYPTVGFNNNWVVVTGNDFLGNGNTTTKVYVFNRADLYSGTQGTVHTYANANVFGISPAATVDTTQNVEYMVADWDGYNGGYGYMRLYTITGSATSPAFNIGSTFGVNQPWDEETVNAPQKNSTHRIEVNDTRVSPPIYINGSLWFTHNVYLPYGNPDHAAVDWWQIDPATVDLIQFGRLEDNSGSVFYYYPSLSVNDEDDMLIGYTVSSSTMYASAQYSYHSSLDTANSLEDGYVYQDGLASYWKDFGSGRNRWGDFSGTCTDPVDNSFWTFQEYADFPANNWATSIANVGGIMCDVPSAGFISPVYASVCPGDATILYLLGYSDGVQGIQLQWQQSGDGANWADATGIGNTTERYETGAIDSTTYFRCVVSCSVSGYSDTTEVLIENVNGFIPIANDTICSAGTTQLIVTTIGATNWFETDTSSIPFFTGDTLNATINGDTTFYINTSTLDYASVGIANSGNGSYYNYTFAAGLAFEAISNFVIDTVFLYAESTGTIKVNLFDVATEKVIDSATFTITSGQVQQKTALPIFFSIAGGATYNLNAAGSTVSAIYRTSSGANYPYEFPGVMSITNPINNASGYYYFFYDWRVKTGCVSEMFPVNVHVDVPNVVATTPIDTICVGDGIPLYASGASSYEWQPGNLTGSTVNVEPAVTTTYTVTGTDGYGCSNSSEIIITVKTCAVNVESMTENSGMEIYPNPTTGIFNLSFNEFHNGNYVVTMLNLFGQEMLRLDRNSISVSETIPIDVTSLPAGVYFIRVTGEDQQWMKRLLKE